LYPLFPTALEGIRMITMLLVVAGAILITTLEPRNALRESAWNMRSFTRVVATLLGLLTLISPFLQRWVPTSAFAVFFELLVLVLIVGGLIHLACLACRLPDTHLERAATLIQWGLSLSIIGHIISQHVSTAFVSVQGGLVLAGTPFGPWKVLSVLSWTGMIMFGFYLAVILNRFVRAFGSIVRKRSHSLTESSA
jgi:hypothetical protein